MATEKHADNAVNQALKMKLGDKFESELSVELEEAGEVEAVVIAMIDLDRFMPVNTKFGMAAGDRVLIEAGEYLRSALPEGARIYRYSGDQFAVIFPKETDKETAFLKLEGIRQEYPVKAPDGEGQTITIGVAAAPEDGTRYQELVRKADGAMYRGKVAGNNRVCLAREEKMVTKTSHYTVEQLQRLTKLSKREGIGEAILLREALDALFKKYDV